MLKRTPIRLTAEIVNDSQWCMLKNSVKCQHCQNAKTEYCSYCRALMKRQNSYHDIIIVMHNIRLLLVLPTCSCLESISRRGKRLENMQSTQSGTYCHDVRSTFCRFTIYINTKETDCKRCFWRLLQMRQAAFCAVYSFLLVSCI